MPSITLDLARISGAGRIAGVMQWGGTRKASAGDALAF